MKITEEPSHQGVATEKTAGIGDAIAMIAETGAGRRAVLAVADAEVAQEKDVTTLKSGTFSGAEFQTSWIMAFS